MILTPEQQSILDGAKGETMAKVMKTLVVYGETFGATKMVPVTGEYGHLVTSFGLSVMKPVYSLMDQLIQGGALSGQNFSVDPRPLDKNVPANFLQNLVFGFMYGKQADYEAQLETLGLLNKDAFTCTCYLEQVGNTPKKGDVLSWAESSAVVYANSVLGARCNRNSGILELFGSSLVRPTSVCSRTKAAKRPGLSKSKRQEAGSTDSGQRHRHEGHGRCSLRPRAGQVPWQRVGRGRDRLPQGLWCGNRQQRRGRPLPH